MRVAILIALTAVSGSALAGIPTPSVPEPSVWGLLGIAAVVGLIATRKRK